MNKYPCELIRDLIPLYKDDILSAKTEEIITEHLEECQQCRDFISNDYSQPINTELAETLPEADTFKKVSKRVKKWGLYAGLGILVIIIAAAAISFYLGRADREPSLSVRQAVNIFAQADIHLNKTSDPDTLEINGVKPVSFFINNTENKLHIYHYDSIAERKTAFTMWSENNKETFFYNPNRIAKNLMFIVIPVDEKQMTMADMKLLSKVSKTIFEKLNDTQEIVFTGASENWAAEIVVKYYEYFYNDENTTLMHESYYNQTNSLKYLGPDIESVGEISYEIERLNGKISGTDPYLKPDGTVSLGSSGGSGAIPRADQELTFTIKWNDQEETFVARAK